MVRIQLVVSLLAAIVAWGCVDNEQTFYVEHAKVPPDPPECTVSVGDAVASAASIDLMQAWAPTISVLATNALMSQENYGRLKAESNGIIVDGYEVYTMIPGEGVAPTGTEYYEYNHYIAPESTDLLHAIMMTSATTSNFRTTYGCGGQSLNAIADAIFYNGLAAYYQSKNTAIPADIASKLTDSRAVLAEITADPPRQMPDTIYSVVRFLGHTQGNKDVETPEFTFALHPYCGPVGGWKPCIASLCTAFCQDDAAPVEACSPGLNAPMTCADYLAGAEYSMTTSKTDQQTNEIIYETKGICDFIGCP